MSIGGFNTWLQRHQLEENLNHPHVVNYLYSELRPDSEAVVIEEMVTAGSLRAFLHTFSNPKLRVCQSWLLQILDGLEFLHSRDLVHGNLSCGHVYINTNIGELKIGDLAVVQMSNVIQDTWKSPMDDIHNFGILLLEVALTPLYRIHKKLRQAVAKLYDSTGAADSPLQLQSQLLAHISSKEFASLVKTCLGSFEKPVTPAELRRHAFFQADLEGYLSDILVCGWKKRRRRTSPRKTGGNRRARGPAKSTECPTGLWLPVVEARIVKSTLEDRRRRSQRIVDVTIWQPLSSRDIKTIDFQFDLDKDTVFGVAQEMRSHNLFPDRCMGPIIEQLHKARTLPPHVTLPVVSKHISAPSKDDAYYEGIFSQHQPHRVRYSVTGSQTRLRDRTQRQEEAAQGRGLLRVLPPRAGRLRRHFRWRQ